MSAINVNSITGRTGGHGPVLTGVTTVSDGNLVVIGTGASIGIGTSTPEELLNIFALSGTDAAIQLQTTILDVNKARISKEDAGELKITSSLGSAGKAIVFETKGQDQKERMRIKASGEVGIGTGVCPEILTVAGNVRVENSADAAQYLNLTYQGIDFQNTGAGSSTTSSAHLLDDYEEGTWTPGIEGNGTAGSYTFTKTGAYTKVGNKVTVWAQLSNITTVSAGSGAATITGLPFAPSASLTTFGTIILDQWAFSSSQRYAVARVQPSQTIVTPRMIRDNLSDNALDITSKSNDNADISLCVTYFV